MRPHHCPEQKIFFFCRIFTMLKEHPKKVLNRKKGEIAGDITTLN